MYDTVRHTAVFILKIRPHLYRPWAGAMAQQERRRRSLPQLSRCGSTPHCLSSAPPSFGMSTDYRPVNTGPVL